MLNFKINGQPYQMAQAWEELTAAQVWELLPYLYANKNLPEVIRSVRKILVPIPRKLLVKIATIDIFRIQEKCLWLWEKPVNQRAIIDFTFKKVSYLLPEADFSNLNLVEYAMADHYFRAFSRQKPDPRALDNLVATLCRPRARRLDETDPEWNGDRREKYNSKIAERRSGEFTALDMRFKMLALHRFIQGQKSIHQGYAEIFEDSNNENGNRGAKPTGPNFHWLGLIDDLAEQGIFGDWEKTAFTPIHTVLFHLRKKHYRLKELEQQR